MTLQLLHSEFSYIWGKFYFLFISVAIAIALAFDLYVIYHHNPCTIKVVGN
jgi:hypothetical protein